MRKIIGTVCFIIQGNQVLLAEIEYPDGTRLWNGIGGVVDSGESPEEAVSREISEETCIVVGAQDLREATIVHATNLELHVFTANKWGGVVAAIDPTIKKFDWYDFDAVPYHQMHPGNDEWLPQVLAAADSN